MLNKCSCTRLEKYSSTADFPSNVFKDIEVGPILRRQLGRVRPIGLIRGPLVVYENAINAAHKMARQGNVKYV